MQTFSLCSILWVVVACSAEPTIPPFEGKSADNFPGLEANACIQVMGFAEQFLNPRFPEATPSEDGRARISEVPFLEFHENDGYATRWEGFHGYDRQALALLQYRDPDDRGLVGRAYFHPDSTTLYNQTLSYMDTIACNTQRLSPATLRGMVLASSSVLVEDDVDGYVTSLGLTTSQDNPRSDRGPTRDKVYDNIHAELCMSAYLGKLASHKPKLVNQLWRESIAQTIFAGNLELTAIGRPLPMHIQRCSEELKIALVPAFIIQSERSYTLPWLNLPRPSTHPFYWAQMLRQRAALQAKLFRHAGFIHRTPHGQNMMLELVKRPKGRWEPTIRWIHRDLDTAFIAPHFAFAKYHFSPHRKDEKEYIVQRDNALCARVLHHSSQPVTSDGAAYHRSDDGSFYFSYSLFAGRPKGDEARAFYKLFDEYYRIFLIDALEVAFGVSSSEGTRGKLDQAPGDMLRWAEESHNSIWVLPPTQGEASQAWQDAPARLEGFLKEAPEENTRPIHTTPRP